MKNIGKKLSTLKRAYFGQKTVMHEVIHIIHIIKEAIFSLKKGQNKTNVLLFFSKM